MRKKYKKQMFMIFLTMMAVLAVVLPLLVAFISADIIADFIAAHPWDIRLTILAVGLIVLVFIQFYTLFYTVGASREQKRMMRGGT
jgi:uncharacterized BrkB/YihY/UPF0761 family membrane protein